MKTKRYERELPITPAIQHTHRLQGQEQGLAKLNVIVRGPAPAPDGSVGVLLVSMIASAWRGLGVF